MSNLPVLRDSRQRMLGGVCAGLARSWQVDPLLVRAGAVVVTVVTSGLALLLYLALWLVIPLDAGQPGRPLPKVLAGLGLLVLVAGFMAPQSRGSSVGFAILAGLGFLWYASSRASRRRGPQGLQQPPPTLYPAQPQWRQPPAAPHQPPWGAPAPPPPTYAYPPVHHAYGPAAHQTYGPPGAHPVGPRRRPGVWRRLVLAIVLAWLALGALDAVFGVRFDDVAYPAAALAILGVTLAAGARPAPVAYARPRGLVGAGLVAALVTAAMLLPANPQGPSSSHRVITQVAQVAEPIDVGVGDHVVDLSGLSLDADAHAVVTMDAGQLTILLPRDVNIDARYAVGLGQVRTPNHRVSGADAALTESYSAGDGRPTLHLTVDADLGDVEVKR